MLSVNKKLPLALRILFIVLMLLVETLNSYALIEFTNKEKTIKAMLKYVSTNGAALWLYILGSAVIASLIIFLVEYAIFYLVLRFINKEKPGNELFMALIVSTIIAAGIGALAAIIFNYSGSAPFTVLSAFLLVGLYFFYSNKNKRGTIIVGIVSLLIYIIPLFF